MSVVLLRYSSEIGLHACAMYDNECVYSAKLNDSKHLLKSKMYWLIPQAVLNEKLRRPQRRPQRS